MRTELRSRAISMREGELIKEKKWLFISSFIISASFGIESLKENVFCFHLLNDFSNFTFYSPCFFNSICKNYPFL